eukprot:393248-Pleurochrysis_carterae.AAC.1
MKYRRDRVESAQVDRRRGMNLRTEMRPKRGQNKARPRPPTTISPTWRGASMTAPLPQCDRSHQSRNLGLIKGGLCVYAKPRKSAPLYPPGLVQSGLEARAELRPRHDLPP